MLHDSQYVHMLCIDVCISFVFFSVSRTLITHTQTDTHTYSVHWNIMKQSPSAKENASQVAAEAGQQNQRQIKTKLTYYNTHTARQTLFVIFFFFSSVLFRLLYVWTRRKHVQTASWSQGNWILTSKLRSVWASVSASASACAWRL